MTPAQIKLCESFTDSILIHFKKLDIPGKCILEGNSAKIQILAYGKTISTTIPANVIINVVSNIESWKTTRYEIIAELTNALVFIGKNVNRSHKRSAKKIKKRKRKVK